MLGASDTKLAPIGHVFCNQPKRGVFVSWQATSCANVAEHLERELASAAHHSVIASSFRNAKRPALHPKTEYGPKRNN
jgi:hypothetical protein